MWGGLESGFLRYPEIPSRHWPPSLLDGSCGSVYWFYAVGSSVQWGGGIPGASAAERVVELWVKPPLDGGSCSNFCLDNADFELDGAKVASYTYMTPKSWSVRGKSVLVKTSGELGSQCNQRTRTGLMRQCQCQRHHSHGYA